jgi:hypothetical protein
MLKLVQDTTAKVVDDPEAMTVDLDELCRVAAQEMLAMALLAERRAYLEAHGAELDAAGHHLVVANGYARARKVTTGAGMVEVQAPGSTTAGRASASARPSCRPTGANRPR